MSKKSVVLLSLAALLLAASAFAQSAPLYRSREGFNLKTYPAAPRLAESAGLPPAAVLGDAASTLPEELDAIKTWNAAHKLPVRNGFSRRIGETLAVRVSGTPALSKGPMNVAGGMLAAVDGASVWSGAIEVKNAYQLRLELDHVTLPAGTVLWVYGNAGDAVAFDASLRDPDGTIWTPSVSGSLIRLEVQVPAGAGEASFDMSNVMELVDLRSTQFGKGTDDDPSCLVDVQCVTTANWPIVNQVKNGIVQYTFSKNGSSFLCSGGLLNDLTSSGTPWLLTANHCISTQASASSIEAHFDYKFVSCVSNDYPALSSVPRANGSTLLANNSAGSDFAFLRLNSVPSGRVFLGWNANTSVVPNGTRLYRVSHPAPDGIPYPQMFSTTTVDTSVSTCTGWPRPGFLYSSTKTGDVGGTYGGSSGSLLMTTSGQVVGQLSGGCASGPGQDPADGCDARVSTVDGAFSTTYPSISSFLAGTSGPTPCTPSASVACINNNRFGISIAFTANGTPGTATAIKYTPDSALFWFFDPTNIEFLVKSLNACAINAGFWFFGAGTTNLEYTVTVTDSHTGRVKTYFHAPGTPAPAIIDVDTFGNSECNK